MKALTLSLLFFFTAGTEAKIFDRCHLASILKLHGLDGYRGIPLDDWICLVHHGNGFNSKSVTSRKNRKIQFFGIFQIDNHWWCDNKQGYSANLCKMSCNAFINDDLNDDIACAKKIVKSRQKMNAWDDWQRNCKGKNVSEWTLGCKFDFHGSG
ncbi:lysozyme C, milk isozyme-like [Crotalus tigris]|uniref:lysozyme C, milk isozyme-like n=1 Tax=Crotalus tigris TaxID=88082 RepID=UPI00192F6253|nr:lysozyme C, milk isozyme-like [Crotalus tigris]XP_039196111.1 lysozyme C, milk isozyme-like [Crotalus tigris]